MKAHEIYRGLAAPVVWIAIVHIIQGLAIILAPHAFDVTALAGISYFGPEIAVTMLLIAGVCALLGRLAPTEAESFWWLAPQQLVLMLQLGGVLSVLVTGQYPDGHVPAETWFGSMMFILRDQIPLVVMTVLHSFAMSVGWRVDMTQNQYLNEVEELTHALTETKGELEQYRSRLHWLRFTEDINKSMGGGNEHSSGVSRTG